MTKRDEILQAAVDCFKTFGYAKTSMNDIGKRVGMNKASLYYHFKDKLALYEAVIEKMRDEHRNTVNASLSEVIDISDQIICFLNHEIDFWSNVAINHQFNSSHKSETSEVIERIISKDAVVLHNIITRGIEQGLFIDCNANEMTNIILQIGQGLLLVNCPLNLPTHQVFEGYSNVKLLIDQSIRIFLKGLSQN